MLAPLAALLLVTNPASAGIEAGVYGGYANTGYFGGDIPRLHGMSVAGRVGWAVNDDFVPELVVSHNRGSKNAVDIYSTPVAAGARFRVLEGDARPFVSTHAGWATEWVSAGGVAFGEDGLFWDINLGVEMKSSSGVYLDLYAGHTLAAVELTGSIIHAGLGAGYKF